jgi:hypothetical protein
MASPSFCGILAAFACVYLDQLKRHVFGKAAAVFLEAVLDPGGHLGAHGN